MTITTFLIISGIIAIDALIGSIFIHKMNIKFLDQTFFNVSKIGGGYEQALMLILWPIFLFMYKKWEKGEIFYSCPKCNCDIKSGVFECTNCNTKLTW